MIRRILHGHLWEIHAPTRYRLVGRDVWLIRDAFGWHISKPGDPRRVPMASLEEGTEYVAIAFEEFGDSAA